MPAPDFFIIGAPKCGTTALYHYLLAHPRVFMPALKEPHFFSDDLSLNHPSVTSLDQYMTLFESASDDAVCGEASVCYLYSDTAVPNILQFNPYAKLIVMIRNPIDMVYAFHGELVVNFLEKETDFATAWHLQEARARQNLTDCLEPKLLFYRDVCALAPQLARLRDRASPDQIKIVVFDDFVTRTREVWEEVLTFLGLPPHSLDQFPVVNAATGFQSPMMGSILYDFARKEQLLYTMLRRICHRIGFHPVGLMSKAMMKQKARPQLPDDMRSELRMAFEDDISQLENMLGRSFRHWLAEEG